MHELSKLWIGCEVVKRSPVCAGLNGRVSSMSASAGDGEPGLPFDMEEVSVPTCTGENSRHVSNYSDNEKNLLHWLSLCACSFTV